MSNRSADWFRQAEADLRHAQNSLIAGDYEWSCFAAHQAAEKGLKAVFLKLGKEAWGHALIILVGNLFLESEQAPRELANAARVLDKYYILTRYPNGFDAGAPTDYFTEEESRQAVSLAEVILEFCHDQIG